MKLALATLLVASSTVASSVNSGTVVDVNDNNNNNGHLNDALPNQRVAGVNTKRRLGFGSLLSGLGSSLGLSSSTQEEGLVEETVEDDAVVASSSTTASSSSSPGNSGGAVAHGPNNFEIGTPPGLPPDLVNKAEEVSNVPKDQVDASVSALVVDVDSTPLSEVTPKDDTAANSGEGGEDAPPFGLGLVGGLGLSSTDGGTGGFGLGLTGALGLSSTESSEAEVDSNGVVTLADLGINETETTMEGGGFNPVESSTDGDTLYGVGDHEGGTFGMEFEDVSGNGTFEEILFVSDTNVDEEMFEGTGVDESEDPIMIMQQEGGGVVDEDESVAVRKYLLFVYWCVIVYLPKD